MTKTIIVVDIETTGFLNQGGKIVEIGIVKLELGTGEITPVYDSLIKEDGFNISHTRNPLGWIFRNSDLTYEQVNYAPTLNSQSEIIQELFNKYQATAYNKDFDFGFLKNRGFKIKELPCPMHLATPILNLPPVKGFGSPKYPTVEEAWQYFFGEGTYIEAHRGLDDAKHEAQIVYELFKLGKFQISNKVFQYTDEKENKKIKKDIKSQQHEFLEIESLITNKIYKIKKSRPDRKLYKKDSLIWALSDKNISLFRKIFDQIQINFDNSHMCYIEINEDCANIGYGNILISNELFLTQSLLYIELVLNGFKPIKTIKEKYGNLPLIRETLLTDTNNYHLIYQIVFSLQELLIDSKIYHRYLKLNYAESEISFVDINKSYIPYDDYFNGYELDAIDEYGRPEISPKFLHIQDDIIKDGRKNLLIAINGYLDFVNPQKKKQKDCDFEKAKKEYMSISKPASMIFNKIDNILKSWVISDKFDHHFYMKHILLNVINLNDLWLGYRKLEDFPNNGFFIGEEF